MAHSFERMLNDQCTESDVRHWMSDRSRYNKELWGALCDMGIPGLLVKESYGGIDAGFVAVERIMEHAGAALFGAPLLTSAVMAVTAIQASGDNAAGERLLPQLASGKSVATLLITSPKGDWTESTIGVDAATDGNQWLLNGSTGFVLHGRSADVWIAVASTEAGPTLFEISPDAIGVSCKTLPAFDHTLVLDEIDFRDVHAQQIGSQGTGWAAIRHAIDAGLVALAGEQAGGARKMLDTTVEYSKTRHQFGRPIGSFQAIKHMAADLAVEVESAISAARQAATKVDEHADDADSWRYLAAFACADAYVRTAADAVQMHGGIAFTWEHPAHLYLRRSRATQQLFGSSDYYRELYLQAIGG